MKIAFEVGLNVAGARGFDVYIRGLLEGLAKVDRKNDYTLFTFFFRDYAEKRARLPLPDAPNFFLDVRRWPESVVRILDRLTGTDLVDRLFYRPGGFDLYHGHGTLPRLRDTRTVLTVFDLIPELFRERDLASGLPAPPLGEDRTRLAEDARRADRIVVPSEATQNDLIRIYSIDPNKIFVTYVGVDLDRFRPQESEGGMGKLKLPSRYILMLGPFERRRNAERVLEAFARLKKAGKAEGCSIVFAGGRNAYYERLEDLGRSLGLSDAIHPAGYVPEEDLPAVYRSAEVFLFPSLADGFGLPILEAMACGTPVIASATSGPGEACADAAETIDPLKVDSIYGGLDRVLADPAHRDDLRRRGLERAQRFTWDAAAERTLRVYEGLADGSRIS